MTDVESTQETATTRPNQVNNPYASGIRVNSTYSPVNVFKRFAYMGICAYGLHHFRVYDAVMKSVDVHHGWFKFGLAVTSGTWLRGKVRASTMLCSIILYSILRWKIHLCDGYIVIATSQ
uniref:Uncharacterized protein n=1 Tax=Craspedostauros australis TaxID=1486917 RepID=A0A7R9WP13_9STRA|mmetsp:Transcript_10888/g.30068  ORF Transcript_10888/g.30068 Transcript_10888/m.30068 type:complete len:120 (+) Transcript_10888:170-529(+)